MRATRSYAFLVLIGLAIVASVGVTAYRTIVLEDYERVDYPEEEIIEGDTLEDAMIDPAVEETASSTDEASSTEPLPALIDEPDGSTPNPFD